MTQPANQSADILREAHALITGPRQQQYAHPIDDYGKVVDIFFGLTGIKLSIQQGLCFMLAVKMARLRTAHDRGEQHYDSLLDAIGYLGCLNMVWDEQ